MLRCCARPPFSSERLQARDAHRLICHLPRPSPDGRTQLILSPLELIGRIAALVPPPRQHRNRYYGVLAPNTPLRAAVTALAPRRSQAVAALPSPPVTSTGEEPAETLHRTPARYLWAMLLARIYAAFPLTCPKCGAEMRIIAFITEAASVQRILSHIGEPCTPPRIGLARGPLVWEADNSGTVVLGEEAVSHDALAQPEPEYEFDQRATW